MALSNNNTLAHYGGGPQRQRQRRCVTVNEPAKGFFIGGSSIDGMNGIYGPVRTAGLPLEHTVQLAYRNDHSGWLMAFVRGGGGGRKKAKAAQRHPMVSRRQHAVSSSSSEDEGGYEWLLIDPKCRDRFAHKGDTIIPGAGHRWWHLHRPAPFGRDVEEGPEPLFFDALEDGYESAASEREEVEERELEALKTAEQERERWTAIVKAAPDDEDELPWQVIALLDASIVHDLRCAFKHYKRQCDAAKSGMNLPKPGPASIEGCAGSSGCWFYRVIALNGALVQTAASRAARRRGYIATGQFARVLERRGDWLRIVHDEARGRRPYDDAVDGSEESWIHLCRSTSGVPNLELVTEEEAASLDVPFEDASGQADAFDRPFEPRLRDPNAEDPAEAVEEEDEELSRKIQQKLANEQDASQDQKSPHEYVVGAKVTLEGLSSAKYNGEEATVLARLNADGRHSVRLASGATIRVKPLNLRPLRPGEATDPHRSARVLGLALSDLGLAVAEDGTIAGSHVPGARATLDAALRSSQRDTLDAPEAWADAEVAHAALAGACGEPGDEEEAGDADSPPHLAIVAGHLGLRAAKAAASAGTETSFAEAEAGLTDLRQLLADEQRRLAHNIGAEWPPRSSSLALQPAEGADALRLRLTVVRTLLRCRRDEAALQQVLASIREHPKASAALLWQGRCLLRLGRRDEALRVLNCAAELAPGSGPDGAWGHAGTVSRLHGLKRAERLRIRGEDAYGYGDFENAALRYGEALAATPAEDKWGRALFLTARAACYRRARTLPRAIADCDAALALFPRYGRALFRRAACLLEVGRAEDAVKAFENLLRIDRSWPNLCDWIVRAHAQVKRAEKGEAPGSPSRPGGPARAGGDCGGEDGQDAFKGKDHYGVLGVTSDATEKQLKRAYRLMSLKYHPDKQGGSTRDFQSVAEAYETLSDPERRRAYDDGADVKKAKDDSDSDSSERVERSLREEVERKYYPERYKFWPFGDPFIEKRKLDARRKRQAGQAPFHQQDWGVK